MIDILSEKQLVCGGNLVILVGPPGCGKSTYAKDLAMSDNNWVIVSPDDIRSEVTGDAGDQTQNTLVFSKVYKDIIESLNRGFNVIYDATNCRSAYRHKILDLVDGHTNKIVCVVFTTSISDCLRHNAQRDRNVPENVIERMYFTLKKHPPTIFEGYDAIVKA